MALLNVPAIQAALRDNGIDAWLFYDHHNRDPLAYSILGLEGVSHVTRRWYYVIPAEGEPLKLVHRIESGKIDALPGTRYVYSTWQELEAGIAALLEGHSRIAMQYSPRNAIMYVSMADAGTVELVRSFGKEIVSSADLVSHFQAVLGTEQEASHYAAQQAIDELLPAGFAWLRGELDAGRKPTEYAFQQWFLAGLSRAGLDWEHPTNVSVNENSADSHYTATAGHHRPIRNGDFLLVDIWGRQTAPGSVFYDITWTGTVGRGPSDEEAKVFAAVVAARDAAIAVVTDRFAANQPVAGWEPDRAARSVIEEAGYGEFFTHRTGHNIGPEIHGAGAHLDDFETHDLRRILPHTCFSVEPGVYPGPFGIRSEINMLTDERSARVTGRVQRELVRI